MGIFDRLQSAGQFAGNGKNSAATFEQEALRLVDEGRALEAEGQPDEAVQRYLDAIRLAPNLARAHVAYGNYLLARGNVSGALDAYGTAIKHKPDYAEAFYNIGNVLLANGQFDKGVAHLRSALEIKPEMFEAYYDLGYAQLKHGQIEEAVESFRSTLEINPHYAEAHSSLLYALNFIASLTPSYRLAQAREFGRVFSGRVRARFSTWQYAARPQPLLVGLVSGDLRNHAVGHFLEGVLSKIDSTRIELIAYSTCSEEDELTARIHPYFSRWRPLFDKCDETAAQLIHADGVHVLIDVSGHTGHNRLPVFSWKPAPVQVSWLGYFATTGVAEMDYLLADEVGVPEAQRQHFTESIWYLPDTRLCFTAPKVNLPITPLPALSNGMITFGCFQNLTKVGDGVLEVWGNIFARLPDARLRMQCNQLGDPAQKEQLLQRLQRYGITPERVTMHGPIQREGYLAAHAEVDMILDTFPYTGGTTTCEALWMGVPTLTLAVADDSLLARQGASLLTAAGLKEWIASSRGEYIAKAIELAGDKPALAALRSGLRQQVLASPLFDTERFARNFEEALWGMWQNFQARQEKPTSLSTG